MLEPISWKDFYKATHQTRVSIAEHDLGFLDSSISNPLIHRIVEDNYKKYFKADPEPAFGIFNNFGQRCDDFKKDHGDNLHVLYAGCSFTYAEGVPIEFGWSGLIDKYINENIAKTSGYFNVGKGGSNFKLIQNQIMGYMKYSGKPDVLFINLPEIGREFIEYRKQLRLFNDDADKLDDIKGQSPSTITSLEESLTNFKIMCESMGIVLIIGCWTMNSKNFKNLSDEYGNPFKNINVVNVAGNSEVLHSKERDDFGHPELEQELLDSLPKDDPLRKIIYLALDDAHPGLLGHKIMAQKFINHLKTIDIQAAI